MRTFISIDVGSMKPLVELENELREGMNVKLVEPENIHLTLKFLGEIGEDIIPGIGEVMKGSLHGIKPFTASLHGVGAFPNLNYIKVVWVGLVDNGQMEEIASRLNNGLHEYGFKNEKRFVPHATLARVRSARGKEKLKELINKNRDKQFGEVNVECIRLKKSELTKEGPIYNTVLEVKL
ncbi:MAG: RNA 2',3'-cyclic phosphodiesterase [Candidatus Thermoplasmatota archaeon]|nr:RNA 2',3'-cyclic phosphodiesterase [Candidatus Thermoplasmatota archaeon]